MDDLETITTVRSGSLGNIVHSRNPQGPYTRPRTIPFNPNTLLQRPVRARFRVASRRWRRTLTAAQRQGWTDYAAAIPFCNRIGDTFFLTGQQMHIRCNAARAIPPPVFVPDAPTRRTLGDFSPVTLDRQFLPALVRLAFDVTDEWVAQTGSFLLIYLSDVLLPTRNFFKGPYRFSQAIQGDPVSPPTSPVFVIDPFGVPGPGNRFHRARVVFADGRASSAQRLPFVPGFF